MLNALVVLSSVVFLDVLLSGDNAVVIGMAANTLPQKQRNTAIVLGMCLAAVCRIVLSLFAISLLKYRIVSIIGGLGLLWVVYKLVRDILSKEDDKPVDTTTGERTLLSTIGTILIADISMSVDNVLAVAALARNNPFILVIGLVFSIACVALGAKLISLVLEKHPWLNWVGVALITIVAFDLLIGSSIV